MKGKMFILQITSNKLGVYGADAQFVIRNAEFGIIVTILAFLREEGGKTEGFDG